ADRARCYQPNIDKRRRFDESEGDVIRAAEDERLPLTQMRRYLFEVNLWHRFIAVEQHQDVAVARHLLDRSGREAITDRRAEPFLAIIADEHVDAAVAQVEGARATHFAVSDHANSPSTQILKITIFIMVNNGHSQSLVIREYANGRSTIPCRSGSGNLRAGGMWAGTASADRRSVCPLLSPTGFGPSGSGRVECRKAAA